MEPILDDVPSSAKKLKRSEIEEEDRKRIEEKRVAEERELGLIAPETESKKDKKKKSKKKEKKKRDRDNEEESSESEKKEKKKDKKSKKKKDDKKKDDKKKKKKAKKEEEAPKTAPKAVSKTAAKPAPKVAAKSEPKSDSKSKGKVAEAPQVHLPDLDAPKVVDRYGFADRIATEEDVGIVAYLTDTVGFDGTLRQRFSDFIVNEIDLAQKVVHVTDVSDPMDVVQEKEQPNEAEKEKKTEELKTAISADLFDKIAVAVEKSEKISFTVDTLFDKPGRTRVHGLVKVVFQGKADSSTKEGKVIIVCGGLKAKGDFHASTFNRPAVVKEWPQDRPPHLSFALCKANMDIAHALRMLATKSNLNEKNFRFSGNKDKRAVTTQRITVKQVLPSKIIAAAKNMPNLAVGNFEFVKEELSIGSNWGNRFDVVLRFVSGDDQLLNSAVEAIKSKGFVNYYGLQRFGTTTAGTHIVGIAIMRNELRNAIDLILSSVLPDWMKNRNVPEAKKMLKKMSEEKKGAKFDIEKRLLEALQVAKENFAGALQRLPSTMRSMYLHAFQAYLWNLAASARISMGSRDSVEIGDLVLVSSETESMEEEDLSYNAKVHIVAAGDLNKYSLADVVLPIPGTEVTFPTNYVGQLMLSSMAKCGLEFSKWKDIAKNHPIKGGYRKLICVPVDLSHEILHYDDETLPLVANDLTRLAKQEIVPKTEGKFRALRLQFNLPKGSFATMFCRELQKRETGREYQQDRRDKWSDATKKE